MVPIPCSDSMTSLQIWMTFSPHPDSHKPAVFSPLVEIVRLSEEERERGRVGWLIISVHKMPQLPYSLKRCASSHSPPSTPLQLFQIQKDCSQLHLKKQDILVLCGNHRGRLHWHKMFQLLHFWQTTALSLVIHGIHHELLPIQSFMRFFDV